VAIVAHHPQAVYFGMKSGFVPKGKAPDELIAGTDRGGKVPPESEPEEEPSEESEPSEVAADSIGA
jgi:5-methyltetrahydrofolate--homocysteine methyltransferase